ncbi:MAG: response regulator [Verrucomicrobiota bacterium]
MSGTEKSKRVFIVDDHPMMRDGLRQLIGNESDLELCGEADTASLALELAVKTKPDVMLVDITLRNGNGLDLIKDLQASVPETAVIVLSMHDESLYAERVLRAGGRGYIMKQEGGRKIIEGIRRVADGGTFVSDAIASKIVDIFSRRSRDAQSPMERLTDREFQVFQLIGQGLSTREMAERLHVSAKTIEVHRVNIKEKLNTPTLPDLIRYAVRWVESEKP